ncbi:MAG: phosphatase PAP2 family protein [Clostridiales Family XIII bacterium]|jgi:membrane-associated phospholipid phosphatase|nr:phosphatase PAP2 family protein [Clostridiales Family XIII bacterium]
MNEEIYTGEGFTRGMWISRWVWCGVLLALFLADWHFIADGTLAVFDEKFQGFFFSLRGWEEGADTITKVFRILTAFGDTKTVGGLCAVLLFLPLILVIVLGTGKNRKKHKALRGRARFFFTSFGFPVAVCTGVGAVIHTLIKNVLERPRPDEAMWLVPEDGFSFPSGHSNVSVILYGLLATLLYRYLVERGHDDLAAVQRGLFALLVILVGLSRIYLGVHYPSDVLGGWALGGALALAFLNLYDGPYANFTGTLLPVEPPPDEDEG